jgi:phenylacetate-CoA ligase
MIFNEEMETMSREGIEKLQSTRLQTLAHYVYERQPFYKKKFDEAGIKPDNIKSVKDITKLPFTTKTDLRDNYPFGSFCVPMAEISRIHASSGTTGKPTVVGYTMNDIETWAEVCARCFALSGAKSGDMFQNAYGYGLFTGGLGMHYGAEKMGLTVIPVSGGNTARQILLLQDFKTDIMACTPSYALTLADALLAEGIDTADLPIRSFILGAEPWTPAMRTQLEAKLNAHAVNIYGLSEVIGPGVSNECIEAKDGSHIFEDHFIVEVVDPETGNPLAEGEVGELVFTTLTKEAMPIIRYRTGDLAAVNYEKCKCGRTHARMSQIVGRVDDMLIIRGVNVFPSQIEHTLVGLDNISAHHQIIVSRDESLDKLEIRIEASPEFYEEVGDDAFKPAEEDSGHIKVDELERGIHSLLRSALGLSTKVVLVAPKKVPRSEGGKLKRVVDKRKMD